MKSYASNPTNLSVETFQWLKFRPLWPTVWFLGLVLAGYLTYQFSNYYLILVAFFLFTNWAYWKIQKMKFEGGDFTYGKVVGLNPTLIAVPTNLAQTGGYQFPVVKIEATKIKRIGGKDLTIGDPVAMIGLYEHPNKKDDPFWGGFNPIPAYMGYTNTKVLEERMKQFTPEKWNELDKRLREVPTPYHTGLYKVQIQTSNWKDSPTTDITNV